MSLCDACVTGVRHEGVPAGKVQKVGGVDVYIAMPEGKYEKEKVLLFFPDALGLPLVNSKLLADDYARNGFQVCLIDLFYGDPFPLDGVNDKNEINPDGKYDVKAWIEKHDEKLTCHILDAVLVALKDHGCTDFAAVGYCFGGKYVFNLAQRNEIKVGATSHPSLLEIPGDLEKLLAKSQTPILINSCEVDTQFSPQSGAIADKLLGNGKYTPGYKRVHWDGCKHGFAVRGDMSDPKARAAKEGAFKESVAWLKKYL